MVHICLAPEELIDPCTNIIDTLCLVGTIQSFQSKDMMLWIQQKILPVAMMMTKATPIPASAGPATKKTKHETVTEIDTAFELIEKVLLTLQPSADTAASTELWVSRNPIFLLRIVLIVLPASVSRHNAPSQSIALSLNLKKYVRPKESTAIVPLVERKEYILGSICAIARVSGGLLYTRKTGGTEYSSSSRVSDTHHSHPKAPLVLGGTSVSETTLPDLNHLRILFPPTVMTNDTTTSRRSTMIPSSATLNEWRSNMSNLALGIQLCRRLVDAPCNELDTKVFIEQALAIVHGIPHVTTHVIHSNELQQLGYGGLYHVGKAAVHQPALVVLSYIPPNVMKDDEPSSIVMVGKGIVFDTGGLQIKPKVGQPGMKRDMGGAAAILSAFGAFVRSSSSSHRRRPVHAILCLAENAVSNHALRADDIITMYSGKTVEINNTDAEGRLVLADGVAHAVKHLNPSTLIDMATLTGAQGVATGKHFGALYCNSEPFEQDMIQYGKDSGDLCHPMPYAPELFQGEYQSAVADMKNSVADRANAQVSCAGQFIGSHIPNDWLMDNNHQWCHIDMAYPVFDKKDDRATGYGVGLLYTLLDQYSQRS